MPEFNTYVDVDVYEIWDSCSISEKNELVDLMVEDGYVIKNKKLLQKNNILNVVKFL